MGFLLGFLALDRLLGLLECWIEICGWDLAWIEYGEGDRAARGS